MSSTHPRIHIEAGDTITVVCPVKVAPDSIFYLQRGDVGVVERVDETECTATFYGIAVAVPLDGVLPTA